MIKALRRKFVVTAMLSIFAVLLLIIGLINAVSWANVVKNAEMRLDVLQNEGAFTGAPFGEFPDKKGVDPAGADQNGGAVGSKAERTGGRLTLSSFDGFGAFSQFGGRRLNEEAPFDSRFFTVTLNEAGETVSVDTGRIFAVDETEAAEMAKAVFAAGRTKGFSSAMRYRAAAVEEGTRYLFLDCAREMNSFFTFLLASVLVSVAGMLLFFVLILLFSRMALRPAAESYATQKRFITDASHEIKTPLAVIRAAAEVIELENGESEWTESIRRQIDRLSDLTGKLVLLSRMDEAGYTPEITTFDLSKTVRETAASFTPVAEERGYAYEIAVEDGVTLTGDAAGAQQLVGLLIDNAMKYADPGGTVKVALRRGGRHRELTVYNTLENIEKGSHPEFFERFYRADAARTAGGGHGIGLSVAKAIAERHRGRIAAVSEDGKSILFTCTLSDMERKGREHDAYV